MVEKKLDRHTPLKIKIMTFVALWARFEATLKRSPKIIKGNRKTISDFIDKLMAKRVDFMSKDINGSKQITAIIIANKMTGIFRSMSRPFLKRCLNKAEIEVRCKNYRRMPVVVV